MEVRDQAALIQCFQLLHLPEVAKGVLLQLMAETEALVVAVDMLHRVDLEIHRLRFHRKEVMVVLAN